MTQQIDRRQLRVVVLNEIAALGQPHPLDLRRTPRRNAETLRHVPQQAKLLFLLLRHVNERVTHYDAQIDAVAPDERRTHDLTTIAGFAAKGAIALLTAVGDDATMFHNGPPLAACIDLVPRQHSTGGRDRRLGINKRVDVYLRIVDTERMMRTRMPPHSIRE